MSGLPLCGWIANRIDPGFQDWRENVAALQRRLAAPLLGVVEHQIVPDPGQAALCLDLDLIQPGVAK